MTKEERRRAPGIRLHSFGKKGEEKPRRPTEAKPRLMGVVDDDGPWSLSLGFFETLSHTASILVSYQPSIRPRLAVHYPIDRVSAVQTGKPRDILPPDLTTSQSHPDQIDRIDGCDTAVTKSWMASTQAI
jgi:hypothetical protein